MQSKCEGNTCGIYANCYLFSSPCILLLPPEHKGYLTLSLGCTMTTSFTEKFEGSRLHALLKEMITTWVGTMQFEWTEISFAAANFFTLVGKVYHTGFISSLAKATYIYLHFYYLPPTCIHSTENSLVSISASLRSQCAYYIIPFWCMVTVHMNFFPQAQQYLYTDCCVSLC